jgi:ABC-type oligopeptide transport system substrate-binding subunit
MRRVLVIILALLISAACAARKEVTITNEGTTLKYNCSHFEPQAKSREETVAVMRKSIESMQRARSEDNIALFHSLRAARELRDIRRLEELIISDECVHLK